MKTINQRVNKSNKVIIINNPDGTPRWICPSNSKKPLFLKFYLISGLKSRIFAAGIQFIFLLRLQNLFFKTQYINAVKEISQITDEVDLSSDNWAIFTGTTGPNNKMLLYHGVDGQKFFSKIATTSTAAALLQNEKAVTGHLDEIKPKTFIYPAALQENDRILRLEDISENGQRSNELGDLHRIALKEIYEHTGKTMLLHEMPVYKDTLSKIDWLSSSTDSRLPKGMIRKLKAIAGRLKNEPVVTSLSHGDFTPWNMYIKEDKLAIYDWELAQSAMPAGFDIFHFIIQNGILVDRKPWSKIMEDIHQAMKKTGFEKWSGHPNLQSSQYLTFYLVVNITNYLCIYSKQDQWHTQIHWLLQTWNEALNEISVQPFSQRQQLILDFFDFMQSRKYAAVKFPEIAPELLGEYADIDICIEKNNLPAIIQFFKNHPNINKIKIHKSSFMAHIQVMTYCGTLLHLDLIWKFKRKSLVFLDAADVLATTVENCFGIRQMSPVNLARYTSLFYILNGREIPPKYLQFKKHLQQSNNPLDKILSQAVPDQQEIESQVFQAPANTGLSRLLNRCQYFADTCRTFFNGGGLTITFSGVDGAGKSTVIELVRQELEKKWRKRVVVLRHRPSLLPIISAWKYGKAEAEIRSASTLPRQGNNNSKLGSAARFMYYYSDYLFGQLYIMVKYLLRGYIVLYDRYYFDFINDSKRSNISLPKGIMKSGYRFVKTPDLNFFLYADADTILSRKRELDKDTITQLTDDYLSLFKQLNISDKQNYFAIENITLEKSIDQIMLKAMPKLI